ncbi:uncharacterized protein LOC112465302 [Temnothorax curvispinosus]|uniref:Uncharacterized protein LOC112465302 n=1 Tax=Temnothorax curvispinosus TaxID=300111 RepID=A0A6J1R6W6_9HYME|nr:uncharacterized protein LOC112465302 [Temnothorax curvispinosus]
MLMAWSTCTKTEPDTREPFEVKKFTHEPGIYFEKIGVMNQVESAWKMVIKLDIIAMDHRYQQLQNYMAQTKALCYDKPLEEEMKQTCQTLLQIIEKDNEQVTTILRRLKIAYQNPRKTRRGLINGLGTIAKTLFGTMDADDEIIIKEQLKLMQGNQQTIQHAVKHQIKILNATIAHVDDMEKVLQENEDRFLNITEKMRETWLREKAGYGHREELDEHFLILNAIVNDLARDMTDIIEHLTSAKNGILNIRLVPIEDIINNLREIASQIPQGTHFPFQITPENWATIEKFAKISAYCDGTNIYTIIQFPLITYPTYEIIRPISLPIHKSEDIFIFVEINQQIIAIDTDTRTYCTIAENELNKCIKEGNSYVCERNRPVYHVDNRALCEVQAYAAIDTHLNYCSTRSIHANTTIWIALSNSNSWLYSTRTKQAIEITCRNKAMQKIEIERTGQITLKDKCKIITPDMTARTNTYERTTYVQTYLPDYNITFKHTPQTNRQLNTVKTSKFRKIIQKPSELMELSKQLTEIDGNLDKSEMNIHKYTTYPILSSFTGTVLIIIAIAIIYIIKRNKNKPNTSMNLNLNPMSKPRIIQEHIYHTASGREISDNNTIPKKEDDTAILY